MTVDMRTIVGTQVLFADKAGDFNPTAANDLEIGTPLDVQMQFASVAAAAAVNSTKVDLGATKPPEYNVMCVLEVASGAAVAGETVDFYWAPSPHATNASGNPGGVDGVDGGYTGTGASALADSVKQLVRIGSHVATLDDTADTPNVQVGIVGVFRPTERYGCLVVVNNLTGAFHTDDVEMHVVFNPIIPQAQDEV